MSMSTVSFQVENAAGVRFTIQTPYGVAGAKSSSPHNPMSHTENVLRELVKFGYMPVAEKPVNETVRHNLNHPNSEKRQPEARPAGEEAFSEPPIGSGKPRPKSNGSKANGAAASNGKSSTGKYCPLHHTKMRRREGDNGDIWYSHKHNGEWCKGKGTKSENNVVKMRKSG